jgi:hypothetical protein
VSKEIIFFLALAALTPSIAHAQSSSTVNGANTLNSTTILPTTLNYPSPTGDPKLNQKLTESLTGIPAPTGDPSQNKSLIEKINATSTTILTP